MATTSSSAFMSRGVIVLGMHRSGTSMIANLLGRLGCSYGGRLLEEKADNPLGYFEHAEVVDIHDEFLSSQGRTWDDPRPWSDQEFSSAAARDARRRISKLVARDFASRSLWVLKDPRHCRLLPLWRDVLDSDDCEHHFLHVLRDPGAVAQSLARRNDISFAHALLLWLRHYLESERFTRGRKRSWIRFDKAVAHPRSTLATALETAGLADLAAAIGTDLATAVVVSEVHHHGELLGSDGEDRFPWVVRAFSTLATWVRAESPEQYREIDRLAEGLDVADRLFSEGIVHPISRWLDELRTENRKLRKEEEKTAAYARRILDENQKIHEQEAKTGAWARQLHEEVLQLREEDAKTEALIRQLDRENQELRRQLASQKQADEPASGEAADRQTENAEKEEYGDAEAG